MSWLQPLKDAGLAQSSTQSVGGFRGAHLEQVFDPEASQALLALGEAVRQGEDPMVAGTLAATALFGDWLGAEETKRLLLSFVPIIGQAIAAEDFVKALDTGDFGSAALMAIGAIAGPAIGKGLVRVSQAGARLLTREGKAAANAANDAAGAGKATTKVDETPSAGTGQTPEGTGKPPDPNEPKHSGGETAAAPGQSLPANDYAGGKPGLRGGFIPYEPKVERWGTSDLPATGQKGGKPIGIKESQGGRDFSQKRDLQAQNEAADIIAAAGIKIEHRGNSAGGPDYLIEGMEFDHYLSKGGSMPRLFDALKDRMDDGQGARFVVQLREDATFTLEELRSYLQKWGTQPSAGGNVMQQVVAIDALGNVIVIWP